MLIFLAATHNQRTDMTTLEYMDLDSLQLMIILTAVIKIENNLLYWAYVIR